MNYSKGGGITATGGVALETRHRPEKKAGYGLPYLKIMIVIIALALPGLAFAHADRALKRMNEWDLYRLMYVCFLEQDPAFGGQPEHDLA
jgi:hypothetical protein